MNTTQSQPQSQSQSMKNWKEIRLVTDYLKSIGEAFFIHDARFGIALLALLSYFDLNLFVCGLTASLIGYLHSVQVSTPRALKDCGLIPLNGLFFGMAMASLFERSPEFYACLVLGSFTIPYFTKAAWEVLQHWKLSPFILPYILSVWGIWLCVQAGAPHLLIQNPGSPELLFDGAMHGIPETVFQSMGRLFFLPDTLFGVCVFVLVSLFKPRLGLFFLIGSVIGTETGYFATSGSEIWAQGYYSYCAGLVGLGLASFAEQFKWKTIILFSILSAFFTIAISSLLSRLNLPTLSLPYVVTLWTAFLARIPRVNLSWAPSSHSRRLDAVIPRPLLAAAPLSPTIDPAEEEERVANAS